MDDSRSYFHLKLNFTVSEYKSYLKYRPASRVERKEGRKEMFYLMIHSTHFVYGYLASDIW